MANPRKAPRPGKAKHPLREHPQGWPKSGKGQRIWATVRYRPMAEGIKDRLVGEGYLDVSLGLVPGKGKEPDSYGVWYHPDKRRRPLPEGLRYDAKGNAVKKSST
jgi:hypothetical protein